MTMKIDISKVQIEQLDATSLNWITKFAKALESHNGTILKLRSANLLQQIVKHAKQHDAGELQEIYQNLKSSLRAQVNREPTNFEQTFVQNSKQSNDQVSAQT